MPRSSCCAARGCAPRRRWACHLRRQGKAGEGRSALGCIDRCDEFLRPAWQGRTSQGRAVARASSGPASSSTRKPSSSRTATPSCTALSYLLPGESPTTTNDVFLLTEPLTLPPRSWTAAVAASLLQLARVPG